MRPLSFWRGPRLYQIGMAPSGQSFVGLCNGRVVATGPTSAAVARSVILSDRWRRSYGSGGQRANETTYRTVTSPLFSSMQPM